MPLPARLLRRVIEDNEAYDEINELGIIQKQVCLLSLSLSLSLSFSFSLSIYDYLFSDRDRLTEDKRLARRLDEEEEGSVIPVYSVSELFMCEAVRSFWAKVTEKKIFIAHLKEGRNASLYLFRISDIVPGELKIWPSSGKLIMSAPFELPAVYYIKVRNSPICFL